MQVIPTCSWCGLNDRATRLEHHLGRFFCSCGSLFDGTESEWRRLANWRRKHAVNVTEWLAAHPHVARVA